MKRREFIALVDGAATSWPLAAHAQQAGDEFLISLGRNDRANLAQAFGRGLSE